MSRQPEFSVVIAAYESERTVTATLEALRGQHLRAFETILVDSSPSTRTVDLVRSRFPEVRVVHSSRRLLPHAARNRGAAIATGRHIAFTDADCAPEPAWLEELGAAHAAGHPLVGGPIGCLNRSPRALAIHLAKFAAWLPGQSAGVRRDLPSANLSVSRELFDRLAPFDEHRWSADTELSWQARGRGFEPMFVPGAVVRHSHHKSLLAFVAERHRRGRDFGLMRPVAQGWSRRRVAARLALAPLVAPVLAARVVRQSPGPLRAVALLTLPVQLVGAAAWAAGEARGHASLLGGGAPGVASARRSGAGPRIRDATCASRAGRRPG